MKRPGGASMGDAVQSILPSIGPCRCFFVCLFVFSGGGGGGGAIGSSRWPHWYPLLY